MGLFGMTAGQLFLRVLNLSLIAMPVLGVLALARGLLQKAPRRAVCLLWLVFWLRLLTPFTIQAPWGLPGNLEVLEEANSAAAVSLDAAQRAVGGALNGGIGALWVPTEQPPAAGEAAGPLEGETVAMRHSEIWLISFSWMWQIGVAGMLAYSAVSLVRLKLRLRGAVRLEGNVYMADRAGSPFVLGLLRPKIYLPSDLPEADRDLILRHERAHIRGGHHLLKPLAFLALAVHWLNPLVWWAFRLFVADLEAACDEAAAAGLDRDGKADYAAALLRLSAPRRTVLNAPLAFGEGDPKSRIRRVLDFQRPRTWAAIAVTALAAVLGCFLLTSRSVEDYPIGAKYQVARWVFTSHIPSFLEDPPEYVVAGDYHLWVWDSTSTEPDPAEDLGHLENYDLTRQELLGYCHGGDFDQYWNNNAKPGRIAQAWWLRTGNEDDMFYLIFRTTSGATWLAYGWEDLSERGEDGSDDTTVWWIAELEQAPTASIMNYFQTDEALALGVNTGPTLSGTLECGEKTAAYIDYFDLPDGGVGFAVYRGGKRGGLFSPDRSKFVERTALYAFGPGELTEVTPGSGVYSLPVGVALEYDGRTDMRNPVLCLNENVHAIERTVTRSDGTVLAQVRELIMGRGMVFFRAAPDTAGDGVTAYRFFNALGSEIFFDSVESGAAQ